MIEFGYKTFVIPGILALAVGLWALIVGACREELLKVLERFNRLSRPIKAGLCAIVAMLALFAGAKHGQPTNAVEESKSEVEVEQWNLSTYSAGQPTNPVEESKSKVAIERSEIAEGLREQWNLSTYSAGQPTNPVEESKSEVEVERWNLSTYSAGQPEQEGNILCSPSTSCFAYSSPSTFTSISNWTARGAYCDWQRIDFPDAFQFPVGTNFIDGVTLFAWGELRSQTKAKVAIERSEIAEGLREQWNLSICASGLEKEGNILCSTSTSCFAYSSTSTSDFDYSSTSDFDYSLPTRVSLEPNFSSLTHGLTPSNSYLFAWHNCCVERCATNRVDASIELFRSGAVATTVTPLSTPTPPTYTYQPAVPPAGFIGHGQDADWIRATFPDEADDILSMGYENWLSEWVGENEMNGRYQMAVTIDQPPTTNDQAPIYLVCGPYRVNVTASGTYHFPLEVLTTYETRTYPTAVPLSFAYDDGYTGEGQSYHVLDGQNPPHGSTPLLMMLAEPMHIPYDYWKTLCPDIVVTPGHLPFETASGSHLRFWCNVRDLTIAAIKGAAWLTWYEISHSEVALDRVDQIGWYYAYAHERDWLLSGDFVVDPPSSTNEPNEVVTNRTEAWIFSGETIHTEIVPTNRLVTHVTAVSGTNSTTSLSIRLAEGQSAYVAVYMASTEPDGTPPYDDTVSWSVTSNNGGSLSGSTSVFAQSEALACGMDLVHYMYGMDLDPIVLGGARFTAPAGDSLRLQITVTASDAVDDKRETCVQVVVYPIDENGNVVGLPDWVSN